MTPNPNTLAELIARRTGQPFTVPAPAAPAVSAVVRTRTAYLELELDVTGTPEDDGDPVTGLRVIYRGAELYALSIITETDEDPLRPDFPGQWPTWVHPLVEAHYPAA
ncbi:hypothetical protein [Streptomyces sp. G1]|uniref:hypothetical protein n=1 Tax=Streptomyces sp. G1 TaxID=361572 RepID=UPI00202FA43D|nr:hypothetical protein [Streptomyces sp. G1]MCM1964866.1 hypothetical protein [Streptomyces sp. G1]